MNAMKAKAIRYFVGESQKEFADRIGVSSTTICAIEKQQREITDYIRAKLVRLESELPDDFLIFYEKFRLSI